MEPSEATTYESAALESQVAFSAGDFERATAFLHRAREIVADQEDVVQMGEGALQLVPKV